MTSFYIDSDGYLFGCGTSELFSTDTFKQISDHKFKSINNCTGGAVAIDEDGYLWVYGSNSHGQIGLGNIKIISRLEKVQIEKRFVMVSSKSYHTMAIDDDGSLWACGNNFEGQLGLGDNENRKEFEKLQIDNRFMVVACGDFYTMAIDEDGSLWGCGSNDLGQLGLGDNEARDKFEKLPIDNKFKIVSCGDNHIMAIDDDGCLWGCGSNLSGQLGLGNTRGVNKLEQIPIDKKFKTVTCGFWHTMLIDDDGFLWGCGDEGEDEYKQLGIFNGKSQPMLTKVPTDKKFIMIGCALTHTCAIDENGSLWMCGDNELGQLGMGDTVNRNKFEKVENTSNVRILMNNCLTMKKGSNTKGAHMIQKS